jgi:hypothetical protein
MVSMLAIGFAAGCSKSTTDSGSIVPESSSAAQLLDHYRSIFKGYLPAAPANGLQFMQRSDGMQPMLQQPKPTPNSHLAQVTLPNSADGAFHLLDVDGGLAADVKLHGGVGVPAQVAEGYAVYQGGKTGADVLHRPTLAGNEDFIVFPNVPAEPAISYEVVLGKDVAGLRLVANILEMLDAQGTPRLRVNPPYLIGADLKRITATLSVEDCAVDNNSLPPWNRATTPPGASSCTIKVAWDPTNLTYPVLLDPVWTTTKSLAVPRHHHTGTLLPLFDRVVFVGGVSVDDGVNLDYTDVIELYDVNTATMGNAGVIPGPRGKRAYHSAVITTDGNVMFAGGQDATGVMATAFKFNGVASPAENNLKHARSQFTMDLMQDGKILIAGGRDGNGTDTNTAELYTLGTGFALTGSMTNPRRHHGSSAILPGNQVLVVGGDHCTGMEPAQDTIGCTATGIANGTFRGYGLDSAEVYTAGAGWASAGVTAAPRLFPAATFTRNGNQVLVAGSPVLGDFTLSSEFFSPPNTWTALNNNDYKGIEPRLALMNDNSIISTGSKSEFEAIFAEFTGRLPPAGTTWEYPYQQIADVPCVDNNPACSNGTYIPLVEYNGQSSTVLTNGDLMLTGGYDNTSTGPLSITLIFPHAALGSPNGATCNMDSDCENKHCIFPSCLGPGDTSCASGSCVGTSCTGGGICCGAATCDDASPCTIDSCVAGTGTCKSINRASCFFGASQCGLPLATTFPAVSACYGAGKPWDDADKDGLADAWEQSDDGTVQHNHYVDMNCNGGFDANEPLLVGAKSNVADLFVQYDYMGTSVPTALGTAAHSHQPLQSTLDEVTAAFSRHSINLHWIAPDPARVSCPGGFCMSTAEHQVATRDATPKMACTGADVVTTLSLRQTAFAPLGAAIAPHYGHPAYHYLLFAHNAVLPDTAVDGTLCDVDAECGAHPDPTNSGSSDIYGDDIIVALGYNVDLLGGYGAETEAGTTLHEIGHNFGLMHGSNAIAGLNACLKYKPNYISVMDYSYQDGIGASTTSGGDVLPTTLDCNKDADCAGSACPTNDCHCTTDLTPNTCYRITYSENPLISIDQTNLIESQGVGGPAGDHDIVIFCVTGAGCVKQAESTGGIDWNLNTKYTDTIVGPALPLAGPDAAGITQLGTETDWDKLKYTFQCSGKWGSGAPGDDPTVGTDELGFATRLGDHSAYPPFTVQIDVRPGCGSNWVVVGGPGNVPVAVLGSASFAVASVEQSSLNILGVPPISIATTDVNADGNPDLLLEFAMASLPLSQSTSSLTVSGWQHNSRAFSGTDSVTVDGHAGPTVTIHNDGSGYSQTLDPPFNKHFVTYHLSDCVDSVVDNCGNALSINQLGQITKITSDEPNCGPAMQILGNSTWEVEQDRDGNGDGRVYTTFFQIADSYGGVTSTSCQVQVKHSNGGANAIDSGEQSCSGICP